MQLTGAVVAEYEALVPSEQPVEILVDSIGLGAGVLDRLRELGMPARGINVAESPAMKGTYANLRAELWFKCKGWLANRDVKIPKDEQLFAELASPRYTFTSSGKMQVESKESMKKRGLPCQIRRMRCACASPPTYRRSCTDIQWPTRVGHCAGI